jgi:CheY-like chemotaxis protein
VNPNDLLKPLRGMYLAQLRERTESVAAFLEQCRSGRLGEEELAVMHHQAHKLAGSGTTYGFPLITQTARAMEEALDAGVSDTSALIPLAESLLHTCEQVLLSVERGAEVSLAGVGASPRPAEADEAKESPPSGKIVLIADDDPAIRDLLAYKFRLAGLRAITAADGDEALRKVEEHRPDLAILDRLMPRLDGVAVLQRLRARPETKNLPVIFLTAMRQERDILQGFRLGAADYVIKPFLPEEVLARGLRLLGLGLD